MDYYNGRRMDPRRSGFPYQCPELTRSSCGCQNAEPVKPDCGCQEAVPYRPVQPEPRIPQRPRPTEPACPAMPGMVLAMSYVLTQTWNEPYDLCKGLQRGTIFPELDKPFMRGRCCK